MVDADGNVIVAGKSATWPSEILSSIEGRVGAVDRIVHDSGPRSIWLTRELVACGAPVVCTDARAAHKAHSARMTKSDRADAEALVQLARARMIRIRRDIEALAGGVLQTVK